MTVGEETLQFHEIDLAAFEQGLNNTALVPRKQIQVCGKTINTPSYDRCLATTSFIGTVALGIAQLVGTKSDKNDCQPEEYHNDKYQYAVRSKGVCQTKASLETIQGAIDRYVDKELDDSICAVQCMKLTRGGDWEGYVVFGAGEYDWEMWLDRCATVGKLGQCQSGGKKYIGVESSDEGFIGDGKA